MARPRIVYWNNIPSPYMVDRFNALAQRGEIDFEAWFSDRTFSDRSWVVDERTWRFRYRYVPSCRILGRVIHWPTLVATHRPDLIVSGYSRPSWIAGWMLAKLLGVKTGFRVLKTFDSWTKRSWLKQTLKKFMLHHVDMIETPGEDAKAYAIKSGADPNKIHYATHTVASAFFCEDADSLRSERAVVREKLGLRGITFVFVGRIWKGKGIQYLLDAFVRLQGSTNTEAMLLIVGDGIDEALFRQQCEERAASNVVFAGFVQRDELRQYFLAGDVFVWPTLGDPYGIAVDEAMACGLPILSTSACGEIRARVEEGVNGYIVPPADAEALADKMLELVKDPTALQKMGKVSQKKVANHTSEHWAEDFERMIFSVLSTRSIAR